MDLVCSRCQRHIRDIEDESSPDLRVSNPHQWIRLHESNCEGVTLLIVQLENEDADAVPVQEDPLQFLSPASVPQHAPVPRPLEEEPSQFLPPAPVPQQVPVTQHLEEEPSQFLPPAPVPQHAPVPQNLEEDPPLSDEEPDEEPTADERLRQHFHQFLVCRWCELHIDIIEDEMESELKTANPFRWLNKHLMRCKGPRQLPRIL